MIRTECSLCKYPSNTSVLLTGTEQCDLHFSVCLFYFITLELLHCCRLHITSLSVEEIDFRI